ncbi:alpha-(1,3)-fucosyltransferase C-like [Limulus polyphemus]|uniref:Fucosyltransferase n=1 Tax=Limulus polyphemus TaxID=6850 RepID=A0ABM1BRQ9_LIMPO|nr:alpha-(1,3)-fucosyltransferase C-like [Limulus polyphemus]
MGKLKYIHLIFMTGTVGLIVFSLSRWRPSTNGIKPVWSQVPQSGRKTVLLWTRYFHNIHWPLPNRNDEKCKFSCRVTSNRKYLAHSDVVAFHWRDIDLNDVPKSRKPGQIWAIFSLEPPPQTPREILVSLKDHLNWTISYRRDSDVFVPYGRVIKRKQKKYVKLANFFENTTSVSWVVSNCKTTGGREDYVKELKKHISVDIFGECGDELCVGKSNAMFRNLCYNHLATKYRFYLSFENSICKDYATEKLYLAMDSGMIPVVFGGADYKNILPSDSYIDALKYSPASLAKHLVDISQDKLVYQKYLKWKENYEVQNRTVKSWICSLCEKLQAVKLTQTYKPNDFLKWWFDDAKCQTWKNGDVIAYHKTTKAKSDASLE